MKKPKAKVENSSYILPGNALVTPSDFGGWDQDVSFRNVWVQWALEDPWDITNIPDVVCDAFYGRHLK